MAENTRSKENITLVLGGTGTAGRRVVERPEARPARPSGPAPTFADCVRDTACTGAWS